MSRLLGEIGSPYIAFPQKQVENPDDLGYKRINVDLPPYERMLSQLWSYSGVGDATRRHFPGMSQEEAMACGKRGVTAILWMMATNTIKRTGKPDKNGRVLERSPYRDVYEEASLRYSQEAYPDLRPFHLRDRKIRRVMKQILMDLWNADKKDFREAGERLGFASSLTPELKAA